MRMKMKTKSIFAVLLTVFSVCLITSCEKAEILPRDRYINHLTQQPAHEKEWRSDGMNKVGFSKKNFIKDRERYIESLNDHQIQVVNEGNRLTMVIPTDKYFVFDTPNISQLKLGYLADIVKLIQCFPESKIYVAGFTDDVGSDKHKKTLSQDRAQAVVAYLWAKGIPQARLNAEGYADKYPIGDNFLIHGSAFNRRVEVQLQVATSYRKMAYRFDTGKSK